MALAQDKNGRVIVGISEESMAVREQVVALMQITVAIDIEEVERFLAELRSMHTVQSIFDPTAYMRDMDDIRHWEKLLAALITFRKSIRTES